MNYKRVENLACQAESLRQGIDDASDHIADGRVVMRVTLDVGEGAGVPPAIFTLDSRHVDVGFIMLQLKSILVLIDAEIQHEVQGDA